MVGVDDPGIGGDDVPGVQDDDVPDDYLAGLHIGLYAVAADGDLRGHHAYQCVGGPVVAVLLHESDHSADDDQRREDDEIDDVGVDDHPEDVYRRQNEDEDV